MIAQHVLHIFSNSTQALESSRWLFYGTTKKTNYPRVNIKSSDFKGLMCTQTYIYYDFMRVIKLLNQHYSGCLVGMVTLVIVIVIEYVIVSNNMTYSH